MPASVLLIQGQEEPLGTMLFSFKTACSVEWQEYCWCAFCRRADKKLDGAEIKGKVGNQNIAS